MSCFSTMQTKGPVHAHCYGRGVWGTAEVIEHYDRQGSFQFKDFLTACQWIRESPQHAPWLRWGRARETA